MHAVITAGGRVTGDFAAQIGTHVKALAKFGGTTLLERAIAAARSVGVEQLAVVGGEEVREHAGNLIDVFINEAPSGAQNVHLALSAFPDQTLLYLTSDLPFLSGATVGEFLGRVPPASLAMPLASAVTYASRFPGAPDRATVVGGERIMNGCVFVIPADAAPLVDSVAQKLFNARKDLFGMAKLLGPALLLKFAVKRIRIADVECKAAKVLGCPVFAVRDCAPELCFDVDTIEDYRYARAHA
ncbi:MAG: nucleotidyltransferase family protein [Candidatus Eremiobacteraeota bacterium]|nr:nucleotidyltransferase family protein [Candidatus Eremiobacteraeota bacterium]